MPVPLSESAGRISGGMSAPSFCAGSEPAGLVSVDPLQSDRPALIRRENEA